jgi:hypothetical protein
VFLHCRFFSLHFNAKRKEEDDDVLNCVIIIYCFVVLQLCKQDENMRMFQHHPFFFGLQLAEEHEEDENNTFKHIIIIYCFAAT